MTKKKLPTTRDWNPAWTAFYKSVARLRELAERGGQTIIIKVNVKAAPQRVKK